jgi:hypothetical protein
MPAGVWGREWLNANSQRAYPFTEDATKTDTASIFTVPDDFILALYFPIHAGLNVQPGRFFVRKISIFGTGFNIAVAYDDGSSDPPIVAAAVISRDTHTEYTSYVLPGQDDFDDSTGKIAIGRLNSIDSLPPGQYIFDYADGKLETDAIRPMIRDVRGLITVNGADRSARLYGDIEFVAGSNIRLTPIVVLGQNPQIRIDAIDGEGLNEDCVCDDLVAPCIRTINGIPPTNAGDFTLLGDECLELQPVANGLRLQDKCSAPCCGCDELEALTNELEILGGGAITVQGFVNRLESEVTNMSQVVLGSVLADDGCFTCSII